LSPWELSFSPSLDPKEKVHPLERGPGRMVIPLGMPMENDHSNEYAKRG